MSPTSRFLAATALLVACIFPGYVASFTKWTHGDLQAYAMDSVSLILAATSFAVLYPKRDRIGFRLYAAIAGLFTAFWALEVFGGLAWYITDKVTRHSQRS